MSGLNNIRKGQTAVEMLFILGVILAGIVVVVPVYTQQSSDSVTLTAIRDASSQAAAYINMGVVSSDTSYAPLNEVINNYTGYSNVGFRFVGLEVLSENSTSLVVAVKFEHDLPPNSTRDGKIALAIGEFLKGYLGGIHGFTLRNGHLYTDNRLLKFNVTVGETWEVVS
ncbi:hypothetical protein [Thermococcus sp.]|uniref:hypothetical protein n=1 Tax=Thermococcus sp. TaxID=35749 RepID=UPI0026156243|nr:hypothetical protein [Thermococcus sp.]